MDEKMERINLIIGGKAFPVSVNKSEIEDLKKIEEQVNSKINEFVVKYPGFERIDIYTMAFLSVIFEMNKGGLNSKSTVMEKRLDEITKMLDKSL